MPEALLRNELLQALSSVASSFDDDELAYLALTSKAEGVVRDKLAWALMKRGHHVAREWRERCDLAVLGEDGEPLAVLESKASYTHDTRWGRLSKTKADAIAATVGGASTLEQLVRSDAAKTLRLAGRGDGYILLIAMHRRDVVPKHLLEVVSEARRTPVEWSIAERQLLSYLSPLGEVGTEIVLGDGAAFCVGMKVVAWLCGPVRPVEQWFAPTGPAVGPSVSAAS